MSWQLDECGLSPEDRSWPKPIAPISWSDGPLTAFSETVAQKVIEFRFGFDGLDCLFNIVLDSAELDRFFVEDDVTTAWIPISGLADAADIDHQSLTTVAGVVTSTRVGWPNEPQVSRENTWYMGVTLKTEVRDQRKQLLHLLQILCIFGEHVLVCRSAGRAVDEQHISLVNQSRQRTNHLHSPAACIGAVAATFNLGSCPKNRLFGRDVEPFGIEQGTAIVVAQDAKLEFRNTIEALTRCGAVADHVAQADNSIDILIRNIRQHRFEGGEVSMDIAENRGSCHELRRWRRETSVT